MQISTATPSKGKSEKNLAAGEAVNAPSGTSQAGSYSNAQLGVASAYSSVLSLDGSPEEVLASLGDKNFFGELGGDSLLAAQVLMHVRRNVGAQQIQIRDVLAHPTANSLAEFMESNDERNL